MRRLALTFAALVLAAFAGTGPSHAYSYAAAGAEPLLDPDGNERRHARHDRRHTEDRDQQRKSCQRPLAT